MNRRSGIAKLLHSMFSEDAIRLAAMGEQLEDIRYCTEHKMNHLNGGRERERWDKAFAKGRALAEALDGKDRTFTVENMRRFKKAADRYLKRNPKARLYEGLTETEHFAVRNFYYRDCY